MTTKWLDLPVSAVDLVQQGVSLEIHRGKFKVIPVLADNPSVEEMELHEWDGESFIRMEGYPATVDGWVQMCKDADEITEFEEKHKNDF